MLDEALDERIDEYCADMGFYETIVMSFFEFDDFMETQELYADHDISKFAWFRIKDLDLEKQEFLDRLFLSLQDCMVCNSLMDIDQYKDADFRMQYFIFFVQVGSDILWFKPWDGNAETYLWNLLRDTDYLNCPSKVKNQEGENNAKH